MLPMLECSDWIESAKLDASITPPETAYFKGKEYSVQQILFFLKGEEKIQWYKFLSRAPAKKQTVTHYAWENDWLVGGLEQEGATLFYRGGRCFAETEPSGSKLDPAAVQVLRGVRHRYYEAAPRGGNWWYREVNAGVGVEHWYRDVKITIVESEWSDEMSRKQEFDVYMPEQEIDTSYVEEETYQGAAYSLWSERFHGPIADMVLEQWIGQVTVPCDGGGLFASRACEGVFGDKVVGAWTDPRVVQEGMTQTLRRGKEGSLQVFMFCATFMSEEDYALVRHPYLFVDKYAPRISTPYSGEGWWSSVPLKIHVTENIKYSNPSFSENLLRLGKVSFESEHLHSRYARLLGQQADWGIPVSQTWGDFKKHRDWYFALVGMIPIIRDWHRPEPKFSRVVYYSRAHPPQGCSYTEMEGLYYFYFPGETAIRYEYWENVKQFPTVDPDQIVGKRSFELRVPDYIRSYIIEQLEAKGIYDLGVFVSLADRSSLQPYFTELSRGAILPPEIVDEHADVLDIVNGEAFVRASLVQSISYCTYPDVTFHEEQYDTRSHKPKSFLKSLFPDCFVDYDERDYYVVGYPTPVPGIFYGMKRVPAGPYRVEFDASCRLVSLQENG